MQPYFQVREQTGLGVRSREEIQMFSADAHALATIAPNSRLLAERFSGFPNAEGEGFPGLTIVAFALVGAGCGIDSAPARDLVEDSARVAGARTRDRHRPAGGKRRRAGVVFRPRPLDLTAFGGSAIYQNASQPLAIALASLLAFAGLTTMARRQVASPSRAAAGFFVIATGAALLFALGPRIHALGRDLGPGPYEWLLALPGYDGLRVPARFLMLVAMFLAVLCGLGAADAPRDALSARPRSSRSAIGSVGILAEAWVAPLQTNQPVIPSAEFTVPPRPASGSRLPPIYRDVMALPDPVVLAEFPFGEPAYDVLAVFYAGHHRRPLLNGYSGFFPRSYLERAPILRALPDGGDRAAMSSATPTPRMSSSTKPHLPTTAARRSASGCSHSVRGRSRRTDKTGSSRCSEGRGSNTRAALRTALRVRLSGMRADPLSYLGQELDNLRQQGLYRSLRVLDDRQEATSHFDGKSVVNLSSNNYLGLTTHPRLIERRDPGDQGSRRRLGLGAHDRRHDGDSHGARTPARRVQAHRGRRRLPERLRRERRHGLGDPDQRGRRHFR